MLMFETRPQIDARSVEIDLPKTVEKMIAVGESLGYSTNAELADAIGVSAASFSSWKREVSRPALATMVRIAVALRCPIDELIVCRYKEMKK